MLDVKKLLTKILTRPYVVFDGAAGLKVKQLIVNTTSNSSGLVNISDLGASSSNCSGLQVMCLTSNYKVSNPILWSNSNYYVVLSNWNSATPVANQSIRLLITWYFA